jgi:hypothetical protein
MVGARDAGELFISNSAGGASSLSITGRHGIGRPPGLEWGEMPRPGATGWTERGNEIRTDDRDPPSQRFWARSEEGGVASLRIVHANYPRVTFEYLYYKPVWPPDAAALKDGRLVWKPVDAARSYRVRVDGKVLRTEATEIELPELRRNAFHRIELHAVLENGIESEPYVVETDTYSGSYRVGELEAAAWGANGVSFTHGRAAPPGEELELRLVLATADRLQVIAPYGGTVVSGLGFGSFPARNVKLDLTRDWQVPLAAVPDQVMLVKTADGGLASVAVSILESRGRKLRLRYVVRAPLTLDQALRDIAAAAPEPDAAAGQRARALLGRLRARDPNLRARALDALIRLGLKGARVVLAAREQSNDPDLRAMLERWAMAVYAAELE